MQSFEFIEIQMSKGETIFLLFFGVLFVAVGVWFVISPEKFVFFLVKSPKIIFAAGCASIFFFGFVGFSILKKLLKNEPALIISKDGITDNSGGVSAGFISWSDIVTIKETVVANQRFINLIVKNPQQYIDRQTSAFKRKIMQKNHDIFGTGIWISTNTLKISYRELKKILEERVSEIKRKQNN
jgi:hypothetical protein